LDITVERARRYGRELATMQKRWGRDLMEDPYYSPHLTTRTENFAIGL
jgi:hypothetical protein